MTNYPIGWIISALCAIIIIGILLSGCNTRDQPMGEDLWIAVPKNK